MQQSMARDFGSVEQAMTDEAGLPMRNRPVILVVDICPVRRRGIAATLAGSGFDPKSLPDLPSPSGLPGADVPAAIIYCSDDADLTGVGDVRRAWPAVPLVVLLANATSAEYREVLTHGASAVLPMNVELGELVHAATLVINGLVVLPKVAAGGLTGEGSHEARGAGLTDQEVRWLKALAGGITVAQLARDARYSKRSMYRRLSVLYRRLNVRNRTQALLAASERRLLC